MAKKKHTSGKIRAAAAVAAFTGFPIEGICSIPTIYCKGDCEVAVDGCLGILEYSETQITLKTSIGTCTLCGEGLFMSDFIRDSLLVRGRIHNICFRK